MEEEAIEPKNVRNAALEAGDGKEMDPPQSLRGSMDGPVNTVTLAQTSRIQENKSVLLKATNFVVVYYSHSVQ